MAAATNPYKPYFRMSNAVQESLALAPFSAAQLKIITHLLRMTYGWKKKDATISHSEFMAATNLSKGTVSEAIASLVSQNVILIRKPADSRQPATYRFQKYSQLWGKFACTPAAVSALAKQGSVERTQGSEIRTPDPSRVRPTEPQSSVQRTLEFGNPNPEGSADVGAQRESRSERHLLKTIKDTSTDDDAANPPCARDGGSSGDIALAIEQLRATLADYSSRIRHADIRESFVTAAQPIIDGTAESSWLDPRRNDGELVPWAERNKCLRLALTKCLADKRFGSSALETALRYCVPRELARHKLKPMRADGSTDSVADQVEAAQREAAAAAAETARKQREEEEQRLADRAIAEWERANAAEAAALMKAVRADKAIQARKDPETWEPPPFIEAVITAIYRTAVQERIRTASAAA